MKSNAFRIRDPFLLADPVTKKYYLYGTTDLNMTGIDRPSRTFSVYVTENLEDFDGPYPVFEGEETGFWAIRDYWAAEVHIYKGAYYLFGSFKSEGRSRATQILKSDSPMGPFKPISEKPQTPEGLECLDGTLYVENGTPYLVFCHEWLQCKNGEMLAVELSPDLSRSVGEPFLLFRANDNPCVGITHNAQREECYVTDGPFLWTENGKLHMMWSSFSERKYAILEAEADNIHGKWTHLPKRHFGDGGHAMIFNDFDGNRIMALHSPNKPPMERLQLVRLGDKTE